MNVKDTVTKTDYNQQDNARGYYTKFSREKLIGGLNPPVSMRDFLHTYYHWIAVGVKRCLKVMEEDRYTAEKAYFKILKDGTISVNVVGRPPFEFEMDQENKGDADES